MAARLILDVLEIVRLRERLNCHCLQWRGRPEAARVSWRKDYSLTLETDFGEVTTYEMLRESECTSCQFNDDKSAYW